MALDTLSLSMPPDLASTAILATQGLNTEAPSWAIAHEAVHPHHTGLFEVTGSRTFNDIFRIPNMGGVIREWLFTRPSMEAVGEDAFANSTAESATMVRIENLVQNRSILVTPTVSNHLLLVPCQTINGLTVGLAYIDVTYERDANIRDNRVPTLRLGRFAIDDATGETFLTGWSDNVMVIDWTQSIIKCERVREILLFEAPPDGTAPINLQLRNSFFQRRHCALCGIGDSINNLPPPCSGINKRISQDPTRPPTVTNVGSLYRRFRGSYCGIVLKTPYGPDRRPILQQLVPIIIDSRYGLHTVRTSFKNSLRKNVDIVLGASSNNGYFGIHPRSSSKVLLLRAGDPVVVDQTFDAVDFSGADVSTADSMAKQDSPFIVKRERSLEIIEDSALVPKRCRVEDSLNRQSVLHRRKVRNRLSAQRSNKMRKMMLDAKKSELLTLKSKLPLLRQRFEELKHDNRYLRSQVYGDSILLDHCKEEDGDFLPTSTIDAEFQTGLDCDNMHVLEQGLHLGFSGGGDDDSLVIDDTPLDEILV